MSDLDNFDGYVDFSERGALPKCSGVYFVTEDGQIVYVGQSVNVKRRFIHHHRAVDFAELSDPKVYWQSCSEEELQQTERDYINKFNPRLNVGSVTGGKREGAGWPKMFRAAKGNFLVLEYKTTTGKIIKPEVVRVLSNDKSGIKMRTGSDIITLRFVEPDEIKIRSTRGNR